MIKENEWEVDRSRSHRALATAKEKNARKTVPIRINSYTIVYVTPEQANDPDFVKYTMRTLNSGDMP